jgi:AcrR family transcriptional regulator
MSPRKPAVLRNGDGQNLREYLIATAARLIGQRGSAGLAVREIAREAQVADGVLYNYFEDKEDLLAHALLAHVGAVMASAPQLPPAGTGAMAENLRLFIDGGLAVLARVTPAFAGVLSQPKVLIRFHAMVGGDAAFDPAAAGGEEAADAVAGQQAGQHASPDDAGAPGLPAILTAYLRAEQRIGRIDGAADIDAAATLIVGAMHGQILPRMLFSPPGSPASMPPGLAGRLAETVLRGIAPRSRQP